MVDHYRTYSLGKTLLTLSYKANGIATERLSNNTEFNITALLPGGESSFFS